MLDITLQKGNIEYLIKYLLPETWQRNCYISEFEGKVRIWSPRIIKKALANKQIVLWNNGKDEYLLVSSIHDRHAHFTHHSCTIDLDNVTIDEFLFLQTIPEKQQCVCIKDVIVTSGLRRTFTKGVIYSEGKSDCWTNDQGYTACKFTPEFFNTHFIMLIDKAPCFHLKNDNTCKSKGGPCNNCKENKT